MLNKKTRRQFKNRCSKYALFNNGVSSVDNGALTLSQNINLLDSGLGNLQSGVNDFASKTTKLDDLKTGVTPAHMDQLEIYAALFCLEYRIKPTDIEIELRIYQNDEVLVHNPEPEDIVQIMDKIVHLNNIIMSNEGRI